MCYKLSQEEFIEKYKQLKAEKGGGVIIGDIIHKGELEIKKML